MPCGGVLIFGFLSVYNDLTHPAATSIGPKYAWRTADGSGNNPDLPDMGKVRFCSVDGAELLLTIQ